MKELGEKLRRSRQEKNITLDEINQKTKIHLRYLEALEKGDPTPFAGEVYFKGALRSYAQMVGLNPDQVLELYHQIKQEMSLESMSPESKNRPATPPAPAGEQEKNESLDQQAREEQKGSKDSGVWRAWQNRLARSDQQTRPFWTTHQNLFNNGLALALVLALIVAGIWFSVYKIRGSSKPSGPPVPPPIEELPVEKPGDAPSGNGPAEPGLEVSIDPQQSSQAETAYIVSGEEKLEIILNFTGSCWINLYSDNRELYQQTFHPGKIISVEGSERIWVRLGNPPGVEITVNGHTIEGLQQQINAHNYLFILHP